jgi:hypothetical protein
MSRKTNPDDFYPLLEITDQTQLLLVQGLLEREGIVYHLQNQELQSLFGMGTIGTGYQAAIGPVRLLVAGRELERIRQLLEQEGLWMVEEEQPPQPEGLRNEPLRAILFPLLWLFGLGSLLGIYYGMKIRREHPGRARLAIVLGVLGLAGLLVLLWQQLTPDSRW